MPKKAMKLYFILLFLLVQIYLLKFRNCRKYDNEEYKLKNGNKNISEVGKYSSDLNIILKSLKISSDSSVSQSSINGLINLNKGVEGKHIF